MALDEKIIKLRELTGAGVMACKSALDEAKGDFEKAKVFLAKKAEVIAEKKSDRATEHGLVEAYVHGQKIGVLLEVLCESDFVAKNDEFKDFAHQIAMQIASMNPENVDELLAQVYIRDEKLTIKDFLTQITAKIGENIKISRFIRYELGK